jgi:hypothetical protein
VLVGAGGLLLLGFGLWLVRLEHRSYASGWVSAAIVLYLAALALGTIGAQTPKQARRLATELTAKSDPMSVELRTLLNARFSRACNYSSAGWCWRSSRSWSSNRS